MKLFTRLDQLVYNIPMVINWASVDWSVVSGIGAFIAALVAVGTLIYAIKSGRKQAQNLATQTENISTQTELLRKQVFGEVYETAQIKDVMFFLPEKRKRVVAGFEHQQIDNEEVAIGNKVKIGLGSDTELHFKFTLAAPQRLRNISCGFLDRFEEKNYYAHPSITEYRRPFTIEEFGPPERKVYRDWHGFWHIEFLYPRFLAKDDCFVVCFALTATNAGEFPFHLEITTEEARSPFKEVLWVQVGS